MKVKGLTILSTMVLVLVMVAVLFTGCTGAAAETTAAAAETTAAPATTTAAAAETTAAAAETTAAPADFVVGISNSHYGNVWRERMLTDMGTVAAFYEGKGMLKETIVQQSGSDVQIQIQQIRNMINQGVDYILINPASATGLTGVIEEASEVGIPSMVIDAELVEGDRELALSVATDKYEEMYNATKYVLTEMGGKGDIVIMLGNIAYQPDQKRQAGIEGALKEFPDINVLTTVFGEWNQSTAEAVMNDVVAAYPKIDAVITVGSMGMGAMRAFKNAGRELNAITGDPTVEFMLAAKEQIDAGKDFIFASPANPPGIGATSLGLSVYLLNGYTWKDGVPANNTFFYPISIMVTPENLDATLETYLGADPSTWISEYLSDSQLQELFVK